MIKRFRRGDTVKVIDARFPVADANAQVYNGQEGKVTFRYLTTNAYKVRFDDESEAIFLAEELEGIESGQATEL